jgi:hypothetical protein
VRDPTVLAARDHCDLNEQGAHALHRSPARALRPQGHHDAHGANTALRASGPIERGRW